MAALTRRTTGVALAAVIAATGMVAGPAAAATRHASSAPAHHVAGAPTHHVAGAPTHHVATTTSPHYPVGTELQGFESEFTDPTGMPPGITNGPCTPSAAHPYPVVLVHGTFANENFTWQALAPMLANAGYCVFGLNYGATSWTTDGGDHSYAIADIAVSAGQLADFVSKVLAWTTEPTGGHATQVEMVGHSHGGMMPRYFIEHGWDCSAPVTDAYGTACRQDDAPGVALGAAEVHMLVGMAPSNHGADAYGLVPVFEKLFGSNTWTFPESAGCGSCGEQEAGSPFMQALNTPTEVRPGVLYYVLETADDEVVTPAPNALAALTHAWPSAFLHEAPGTTPGTQVQNVVLQSQCPTDATDHVGIVYDPNALADVMAALADNGSVTTPLPRPHCAAVVLPLVSG